MTDRETVEILIVEDNPEDAELMVRALTQRRLTGDVFIAENGAQALDYVFCRGEYARRNPAHRPKVIFLDLKMPKTDGREVLKTLKTDPLLKAIPVVIVSSSRERADLDAAYALGANSFIVKPVDFESFIAAIDTTGHYWLAMNQVAK
jgi:two-component system response regulator